MSAMVIFPSHALLILVERLREQQAEGVRMPSGVALDELALRILVAVGVAGRQAAQEGPSRPQHAPQNRRRARLPWIGPEARSTPRIPARGAPISVTPL